MIYKNLNRLKYTFDKKHIPNIKDWEALNEIIKYVGEEKERQLIDNHLFAKLYISEFKRGITNSDGNYQLVADSLRMVLKKPLESIYDEFYKEMNDIEFMKFAESKGITTKHPALRSEEEEENDNKLLRKHEPELIKHLKHFNKDDVYERLNKLLNDMLEMYGNK